MAGVIKGARQALVAAHYLPDGDAIGSTVALALALEQMGLEVTAVNHDPVPRMYSFIPGMERIKRPQDVAAVPGLVILLDCSDMERPGRDLKERIQESGAIVVNLDHHISNTGFGDLSWVDPGAAATGELVYSLIREMGVEITPAIATALYTALATDTGSFRFANTTPAAHAIAAELIAHGVDVVRASLHLWEEKELVALRVLGAVLPTLELAAGGQIAWMYVDLATFTALGARSEHCEGLADYPRSIIGVEAGMFFREVEPGVVKVGMRSKTYLDVNELAACFGGGGHQRAAGCTVRGELQAVIRRVVGRAVEMLCQATGEKWTGS
ncbi:MAG: bifunctional oligoribonuclease/PAP phosphatase NrnA [Clostridia bacterium]|nr:MAG: bifunctional oligoribonuclease/PAP phosphatase NrnA [Clostridia bacterium]